MAPRKNSTRPGRNSEASSGNSDAPGQKSVTIRVALYARVSTDGQDVGLQVDDLHAAAEQREMRVVGVYTDEGVSGSKASRPALDRLMADAKAGKVDIIMIWKLDRLARSVVHLVQVAADLNSWGVGLVSLRDAHIDTTTASGRFSLHVLAAVAELELGLIRMRVQAGVDRAKASGKHCGRPTVEMDLRPALAMMEKGHGLKATATALGVSRSTLRRRLIEAGHPVGDQGVQKSLSEEVP